MPENIVEQKNNSSNYLNISKMGSSGNYGYVVYSGNVQMENEKHTFNLLSLKEKPIRRVYLYDKSFGIGISPLSDFIYDLSSLKDNGFEVKTITTLNSIKENSIVVIGQGAMPEGLISMVEDGNNIHIVYVGKTNAIISNGVTYQEWWSAVDKIHRKQFSIFNSTLEDYYNSHKNFDLIRNEILMNKWSVESNKTVEFHNGMGTAIIPMEEAKYLMVLYPSLHATGDFITGASNELTSSNISLIFKPVYPFEKESFDLILNKSMSIPRMDVLKDGKIISTVKLGSIGQNIFHKSISFSEPGNYIIKISDYNGELASGIFHVYNTKIKYIGSDGFYYTFHISNDGVQIDSVEVNVSLSDSKKSINTMISHGTLMVPARLKSGKNKFVISFDGNNFEVPVNYSDKSLLSVYLEYGPFGLILIILIYLAVTLSRKQRYKIRFGRAHVVSPQEYKIKKQDIISVLRKILFKFGVNDLITPKEFSMGLKKYITNGYEVMEGNAESILKRFENEGYLTSYISYYSIKNKSSIKKKVLMRLAREKLIEHGIHFNYIKNRFFETENFIISFGERINRKTTSKKHIVIFENDTSIKKYLKSMDNIKRSKTALKIRNDSLALLTINELAEYL